MKLSDFFNSEIMHKKAKLLIDIDLNNGESKKAGDIVSILKDYGKGYYHAEHNDFACKVHKSEIEFIS